MMKMIIYNDDNSNNKHNNIIYIYGWNITENGIVINYGWWFAYGAIRSNIGMFAMPKKHEPTFRDLMGYTTKKLFCVS